MLVGPQENSALLAGKYRVVRTLGQGGMGRVLEVIHQVTGKRAALKILHPRVSGSEPADVTRRVVREAQAMARIQHRNVIDVYDVLSDDDDVYLVMELLVGETLAMRVERAPVSVPQLVRWLCGAMRGVAACHAAGVIHRDVKPENVFLARGDDDDQPVPVVIDFGISKLSDSAPEHATHSGLTLGTPRYMSLEQLRGAKDVDARTDVYAFGVILYEALTGRFPYDATNLGEQAIRFVTTAPPGVHVLRPELPEALAVLVDQAIAREREGRPATMQAFVEKLAPFALESAYPTELAAYPEDRPLVVGARVDARTTLGDDYASGPLVASATPDVRSDEAPAMRESSEPAALHPSSRTPLTGTPERRNWRPARWFALAALLVVFGTFAWRAGSGPAGGVAVPPHGGSQVRVEPTRREAVSSPEAASGSWSHDVTVHEHADAARPRLAPVAPSTAVMPTRIRVQRRTTDIPRVSRAQSDLVRQEASKESREKPDERAPHRAGPLRVNEF